jgi:hypothetical protein
LPAPSQFAEVVNVPAAHVEAAHWVPDGHFRHAPAPSHLPSVPHVDALVAAQVGCPAADAVPAGIGEHVPSRPETAQL